MLTRFNHLAVAICLSGITITTAPSFCSAQSASRSEHGTITANKPPSGGNKSEVEASLEVLARLRAMRDCWNDPYQVLVGDDPKYENHSLFFRCDEEYPLRLAEAQTAASEALTWLKDRILSREITAAIAVFNDLETLHRVFESRKYTLFRVVPVSDIYPIAHKYNIPYRENEISKFTVYQEMMPKRRVHIDRLASLVPGAPPDPNPTLTPAQAAVVVDDLDWYYATRQGPGQGYNWYLGRHPQGRHAAEARKPIEQPDGYRKEQEARTAKLHDELLGITRQAIEAYVHGDKAVFDRLLGVGFPSRALYISRLRPQPDVASFEVEDLKIRIMDYYAELYRADVQVQYKSVMNKERDYHNSILYKRTNGRWQIVERHSP